MQEIRRKQTRPTEQTIFRQLFQDYKRWHSKPLSSLKADDAQNHHTYQKGMHAMRLTQILNFQQSNSHFSWLDDEPHGASEAFLKKTGAFKRIMRTQAKHASHSNLSIACSDKMNWADGLQARKSFNLHNDEALPKVGALGGILYGKTTKSVEPAKRPNWKSHLHKNHWKDPRAHGIQLPRHLSQESLGFMQLTSGLQQRSKKWRVYTKQTERLNQEREQPHGLRA